MQRILKVVKCGECFTVKSEKAENGCLLGAGQPALPDAGVT